MQGAQGPSSRFIGGKQDAVTRVAYAGPAIRTATTMSKTAKEVVTDFGNLYDAMQHCANGVRWKASVIKYLQNGLTNTEKLRQELLSGTYRLGKQIEFKVYEPKERTVVAMRFRDRQVQRSLLQNYLAAELGLGSAQMWRNTSNLPCLMTSTTLSKSGCTQDFTRGTWMILSSSQMAKSAQQSTAEQSSVSLTKYTYNCIRKNAVSLRPKWASSGLAFGCASSHPGKSLLL